MSVRKNATLHPYTNLPTEPDPSVPCVALLRTAYEEIYVVKLT